METTQQANRFSVMLVDDEDRSRKFFKRMLRDKFEIITAPDARTAREVLERPDQQIAVLITDERMPGESGTELLNRVRRDHPDIVRIMTTAYSSVDHAASSINEGKVYCYLTKPWDLDALTKKVSEALETYQNQKRERELLTAKREAGYQAVAGLAHEITTPLATIRAAGGGLSEYIPPLIEAYRKAKAANLEIPKIFAPKLKGLKFAAEIIDSTAGHCHFLVSHFLANRNTKSLDPKKFNIGSAAQIVTRVVELYPLTKSERETVFEFDLKADFSYLGSEPALMAVLFNLIKNALYASPWDRQTQIKFRLETGEKENRIICRDNGNGIPEENLPHIYNESFSTKGLSGHGMGLAFCKEAIRAHGGTITCRSQMNAYTSFTITLPTVDQEQSDG